MKVANEAVTQQRLRNARQLKRTLIATKIG